MMLLTKTFTDLDALNRFLEAQDADYETMMAEYKEFDDRDDDITVADLCEVNDEPYLGDLLYTEEVFWNPTADYLREEFAKRGQITLEIEVADSDYQAAKELQDLRALAEKVARSEPEMNAYHAGAYPELRQAVEAGKIGFEI